MASFASQQTATHSFSSEETRGQHRARILLADDNPEFLQLVTDLLEPEYLVIGTVRNGEAALRETIALKPDIVLLDISMGIPDGITIAKRLREEEHHAKIVFLTVHEIAEFVRVAVAAGAAGYVFKSRLNTDLIPALRAVVSGRLYISCHVP